MNRARLGAVLLVTACAHRPNSADPIAPCSAPDDYVTIMPTVSVSRHGTQPLAVPKAERTRATPDPNEDVIAEILALPPGESKRRSP